MNTHINHLAHIIPTCINPLAHTNNIHYLTNEVITAARLPCISGSISNGSLDLDSRVVIKSYNYIKTSLNNTLSWYDFHQLNMLSYMVLSNVSHNLYYVHCNLFKANQTLSIHLERMHWRLLQSWPAWTAHLYNIEKIWITQSRIIHIDCVVTGIFFWKYKYNICHSEFLKFQWFREHYRWRCNLFVVEEQFSQSINIWSVGKIWWLLNKYLKNKKNIQHMCQMEDVW